ncbi:MAG: hypothetical protein Q9217_002246 [Psora testacea]
MVISGDNWMPLYIAHSFTHHSNPSPTNSTKKRSLVNLLSPPIFFDEEEEEEQDFELELFLVLAVLVVLIAAADVVVARTAARGIG